MTLVRTTVGDVVAQQAKEGTMHLLKHIERELYWGHAHFANPATGAMDGSMSDLPANSIAMNGLLQQLLKGDDDAQMKSRDFEGYGDWSAIGYDLAGAIIQQDDIERMCVVALENFGSPDQLHIEPIALSAFVRQFYPQFRSAPGLANQTVGYDVSKVTTTAGSIDLKPNLFLRPRAQFRTYAVNANAPALGAAAVASADLGAGQGSLVAGTYQYKVTFVNDFGESAPVQAAAAVVAADNSGVELTVANMPTCKYIKVYRSAANGAVGSEKFIGNYKFIPSGVYVDSGAKEPGLGEAFLLDLNAECMKFKQLAPLSKINFAIVATALEFAIVLYGALFVYTPRFNAFFKNVGK